MKMWSRLCFLVLAISSVSRGHNQTAAPPHDNSVNGTDPSNTSPQTSSMSAMGTRTESLPPTSASPSPQDPLTMTVTAPMSHEESMKKNHPGPENGVADKEDATVTTAVSMTTGSTSSKPVIVEHNGSWWGYVVLFFIILIIIALCIILFLLRRTARTYSFDLRPLPVNHQNEPTGTFEQVYLDDLDQPATKETTDDLSPPPVANGTNLQAEEKGSNGENAPQEQPDANGLENSLSSNTSPSLGDDPADKTSSPLSSTNLLFDAIGEEQQNENNNNPSVCSSDPFVEINLDDPAWCNQFLTSPNAPSSVLPFSPFNFSSS